VEPRNRSAELACGFSAGSGVPQKFLRQEFGSFRETRLRGFANLFRRTYLGGFFIGFHRFFIGFFSAFFAGLESRADR